MGELGWVAPYHDRIVGEGGGGDDWAAHDEGVGITRAAVGDDLDVRAERTAGLSREPRCQSHTQVESYLIVRDGATGHGDRREPVEFAAQVVPLLPRAKSASVIARGTTIVS